MIKTAIEYHDSTRYDRNDMSGHFLDWKNQPMVFKDYPGILPIVLPAEVSVPSTGLSELIEQAKPQKTTVPPGLKDLSSILRLSNSLTARARQGGGDFYFRSAASAGALYPCEIYVAAHSVDDMENGLYHFAIHRHCLYPLRRGEITPHLAKAVPMVSEKQPGLIFLLTAIYFRSAWKYRERSYRYHLLDSGHLLENLILALNAMGLNSELSLDFNDDEINRLLGLDEQREACLAVVFVSGHEPLSGGGETPENLSPTMAMASRVAAKEVVYPAVREIHQAGKNLTRSVSCPAVGDHLGLNIDKWIPFPALQDRPMTMGFAEAVYRRRSRRNFIQESVGRDQLSTFIDALGAAGLDRGPERNHMNTIGLGLLINRAEGIDPGLYMADQEEPRLGLIKSGTYVRQMSRVCLDQAWLANAALHVLFMTNLKLLEETMGPRGYRYAMMTAGRLGQRIYLMATAMGLGCCGIGAFYDQEACDLLEMNQDSRLLYLVAVGPVKSG
jgi:SagB-type dehydrogenase family enzyme